MYCIVFWLFRITLFINIAILFSLPVFSQASVNNISELRSLAPSGSTHVVVAGYYTAGDDGGGTFIWNSNSSVADNGGTVIRPSSNPSQGRWIRDTSQYDYYSVRWFGARGRNNPDDNDHISINNCITASVQSSVKRVFVPVGIYQIRDEIHLTSFHNDLEIFGERVVETTGTIRGVSGLRVVDESQSSVIKRADTGPYRSDRMIFIYAKGESDYVENIKIRKLALDGNRHHIKAINQPGLGHSGVTTYYNGGDVYPIRNLLIENVYAMRHEHYREPPLWNTGAGIMIYNAHNVTIRNSVAYDCWMHGMANNATKDVTFENIEIHSNNNVDYAHGLNNSTHTTNTIVKDFYIHNNSMGVKAANAYSVEYIKGLIKSNSVMGLWTNTENFSGILQLRMVDVVFDDNLGTSLQIDQGPVNVELINITAKNGRGDFDYYFTQSNITANGLKSEGFRGTGSHAVWLRGADQIINNLIIKDSHKPGLRVSKTGIEINGGKIINNKEYGILIAEGTELKLRNLEFGGEDEKYMYSQSYCEILCDGKGVLIHSGLNFSNSKVSPESRIRVRTVIKEN